MHKNAPAAVLAFSAGGLVASIRGTVSRPDFAEKIKRSDLATYPIGFSQVIPPRCDQPLLFAVVSSNVTP